MPQWPLPSACSTQLLIHILRRNGIGIDHAYLFGRNTGDNNIGIDILQNDADVQPARAVVSGNAAS